MTGMFKQAAINELIIAGLMTKNSELFVKRLSLLSIDVDSLVNGVVVAVAIKDHEALKKECIKRSFYRDEQNFTLDDDITVTLVDAQTITVFFTCHYTNKDGVVKQQSQTREYSVIDPDCAKWFAFEII